MSISDLDHFTYDDILTAIRDIDRGAHIPPNRRATGYDVVFEGKRYPPKYLFSLAARLTGKVLGGLGGGAPTNDRLTALGFKVIPRADMSPSQFKAGWAEMEESDEMHDLQEERKKFNYFRALGIERAEIRHSAFLAFLFDPQGAHGLGEFPARCLLGEMRAAAQGRAEATASPDGVAGLADLVVSREYVLPDKSRIDLFLRSDRRSLAVLIENKLDSAERGDQLKVYADWAEKELAQYTVELNYLTVSGDRPSDSRWRAVDYGCIHRGLKRILADRPQAPHDVVALLEHYVEYIESDLLRDGIIASLCRKIWHGHRDVLEHIYRFRSAGDDANANAEPLSEEAAGGSGEASAAAAGE